MHLELGVRVERAEGLVHQQNLGFHDQRAHRAPRAAACRPRASAETCSSKPARPGDLDRRAGPSPGARRGARRRSRARSRYSPRRCAMETRCRAGRRSRRAGSRAPSTTRSPSMAISPPERGMRPATMLRMVLLPQPGRSEQGDELALPHVERDVLDRDDAAPARRRRLSRPRTRNPHGPAIWAPGGPPGGFDARPRRHPKLRLRRVEEAHVDDVLESRLRNVRPVPGTRPCRRARTTPCRSARYTPRSPCRNRSPPSAPSGSTGRGSTSPRRGRGPRRPGSPSPTAWPGRGR